MPPLPRDLPADRPVAVANRLNSAAIHLLRRISQEDGADGLTGARASALSVLVYGGPATMGELARRERVAVPTMSRLVEAMVRDRLVSRREGEDRREVRLEATPRGRRLMERGRSRRIGRLAAELRGLAAVELDVLEKALEVLVRLESAPTGKTGHAGVANARHGKTRRTR
jgi:DNA-binding MarR family transcriptional regulator